MLLCRFSVVHCSLRQLRQNTKSFTQLSRDDLARGPGSSKMLLLHCRSGRRCHQSRSIGSKHVQKCVYALNGVPAKARLLFPRRGVAANADSSELFAVSSVPYSEKFLALTDISAWINLCDNHAAEFQGLDNFAAIRKLVEVQLASRDTVCIKCRMIWYTLIIRMI